MSLLIVDENKCKQDGLCVRDCPTAIIRLKGKESFPELVPGGEPFCLGCGHCVAVCPHGALSHKRVPIEDCPSIRKELVIDQAQAVQFLRSRRSIRSFKDRRVEKEKIQQLIEVARYAPTASNSQRVEWLVFNDRHTIKGFAKMAADWARAMLKKDSDVATSTYLPAIVAAWDAGLDAVLRDAPALVVASAPKEDSNGMVNLTLALSYLELAAPSLGLGTCWAGLLQGALLTWPPLQKALDLPEDHTHHYPMMLGYPKAKYFRLPERKPPKITWKND
ncbi:MAG: nitroreductase family protein [Desulfobacterales bacterium]|jgi:nitroreductase/NAD-dependent dihydropyrimidine dehydrogenase PreA subunit